MRSVYSLARSFVSDHHAAEDLSQEVFIRAYQSLRNFRGEAKLSSWLHRIAINTWIDQSRTKEYKASRQMVELADDGSMPLPQRDRPADNPERLAESQLIQRNISRALKRLSTREQAVFVLKHYHQLKIKEIAGHLQITEGTVKKVHFRAIQKLRDELSVFREYVAALGST